MFKFGTSELLIILVIVIVIFGPGRLGKVMGELGKGIRSFKDNFKEKPNQEGVPSSQSVSGSEDNV
ncbi:MAG TPA: twin-arginine translocase TatA/TatE family subunit [Anaerolineales bacterium]|nr:twin-arginine translocase TatA/TatE family subunit [Anaerolineales bacterium]